jgi:hypothetical protein
MFRPPAAGAIGADDIPSKPEGPLDWVWHGFVAPGNLTLLTGPWKAGKTTLLSALLSLRVAGGALGDRAARGAGDRPPTPGDPRSARAGSMTTGDGIGRPPDAAIGTRGGGFWPAGGRPVRSPAGTPRVRVVRVAGGPIAGRLPPGGDEGKHRTSGLSRRGRRRGRRDDGLRHPVARAGSSLRRLRGITGRRYNPGVRCRHPSARANSSAD